MRFSDWVNELKECGCNPIGFRWVKTAKRTVAAK